MTSKFRNILRGLLVIVLLGQLTYLIVYSVGIFNHDSLSWDSSLYIQPWWLISKGNLWPYSTTINAPFFGNHGELIMWLLGLFGLIFRSPLFLLELQDVALIATEAFTLLWIYEIIFDHQNLSEATENNRTNIRNKNILFFIAVVILLVNPWNYWALGADFHIEPLATLFLVMSGRYLYRNDKKYIVTVGLTLLCGQVAAIWLVGLAISVVFAGDRRIRGLKLLLTGFIWYLILGFFGADQSNTLSEGYGYLSSSGANVSTFSVLIGAFEHLNRLISKIAQRWKDIWAYVSAPGLIGIISPWGLGVTLVILFVNMTNNYRHGVFSFPGFQGMPIGFFMVVGFVDTVVKLINGRSYKILAKFKTKTVGIVSVLTVFALLLTSIGWAVIWIPQVQNNWEKVSSASSATLNSVLAEVPSNDEVIASQGIVGRFATRKYVYPLRSLGCVPLKTAVVWFVVSQNQGIETLTSSQTASVLSEAIFQLGADIVSNANNIWLLKVNDSQKRVCFKNQNLTAASFLPTNVGIPYVGFDSQNSYMYAGGTQSGYVTYGAYDRVMPGRSVTAQVKLSSFSGVDVELWDDSTNTLLDRLQPDFNGVRQTFNLEGTVPNSNVTRLSVANTGKFIFVAKPASGPKGDLIEVRVYTSGGNPVKVYSVSYG